MKKEIWKKIEGTDYYYASNLGRIKTVDYPRENKLHSKNKKGKIISLKNSWGGYISVSIKRKSFYLHRVIAKTFIPNPQNKPCVNHINGIKHDNRVENLEWVTYSENELHHRKYFGKKTFPHRLGMKAELSIFSIPIAVYKHSKLFGVYCSQREAAKAIGVSDATVSDGVNNIKKPANGFSFKRITRSFYYKKIGKVDPLKNPNKLAEYKKIYL